MKKIFLLFFCVLAFEGVMAQAPKWVEKAKRAVFSVITYDKDNRMLSTGNGFFIAEDGTALSDYRLFKNAAKAVAVNSEGTQLPVEAILGASELYDVIKFRVATQGKKVNVLTVAAAAPAPQSDVYLLPYSTQKDKSFTAGKVQSVDAIEGKYAYVTLGLRLKDKMVSCPLVTAQGEVFGLAQKSSGQDTATVCYAMDARYARDCSISAFSFNDLALRAIDIPKALPDTEEQALVYLYMASTQVPTEEYGRLLDQFVAQYPASADGYMRRATYRLTLNREEATMKAADEDMNKAIEVAVKKDETYYSRAKLVYSYALDTPENRYAGWDFDKAMTEIDKAIEINPLPIYKQLKGDISFAKADYPAALAQYEQVNQSELASAASFFSTAKTKEMMQAPVEEVLALMDSCMARFTTPYTEHAAPYLLERARVRMDADQARLAVMDYDAYFTAVAGKVNDVFYYYREQAALKSRQYQRALDDIAKAVELAPKELTYRAEQAVVNIRVGRNEEAVKVLQETISIDDTYGEAHRLMGVAYIQMKQKDKACECFNRAKQLGDTAVDALIEKHCK